MAVVPVVTASLAVVVADVVLAPRAAPARADASTGAGGLFVDAVGRLLDTRNGTGGYSTPMPTLTWRSVAVDGQDGIPASGVSAVQVTVTAVSPAQAGIVYLAPDGVSNPPTVSNLVYDHGVAGSISNTAIVAVGTNGKIQARANSPVNLILDVQGYYTAGVTAAGGYVPLPGARIVNTRDGTGVPQAKLGQNSTTTIQVGGRGGVSANASAVFVTLTPTDYHPTAGGSLTVYPAGGTVPTASLNFSANISTALGAEVDLIRADLDDRRVHAGRDPGLRLAHRPARATRRRRHTDRAHRRSTRGAGCGQWDQRGRDQPAGDLLVHRIRVAAVMGR